MMEGRCARCGQKIDLTKDPIHQCPPDSELHKCPRRMEGPFRFSEFDTWQRDRWKNTKEEADKAIEEFKARNSPGSSMSDPQWHGDSPQPRTCSFCGSIHPDDLLQLLLEGWELEPTDKGYKYYVHPKGWRENFNKRMSSFTGGPTDIPRFWSPTPPVKSYVMHASEEQIKKLNDALKARRASK